MTRIFRRSVFAFVLGAALAAAVLVGRSAFATTDTVNACFKPSNGTLYLLGSGRSECQPGDIPISWNTSGVNGQDGVSVTSQALAPNDDANCPNGGSKFTAANGVSYACNGTNGTDGTNGTNGTDGTDGVSVTSQSLAPGDDPACPNGGAKFTSASGVSYACNGANGADGQDGQFSGTFTSPNGLYKLVVNDTSAQLVGPNASVQIAGNGVIVAGPQSALNLLTGASSLQSQAGLTLNAASALTMGAGTGLGMTAGGALTMNASSGLTMTSSNALGINAANALTLHAQGLFSASGATTTIGGTPIILNAANCGVLRPSDVASSLGAGGGTILLNPNGSPTVRTGC